MGLPTVWLYDGNIDIFYPIAHQQYTMVSASPVQPSLNLEFLYTYWENLQNVSVHFIWENVKKGPILYEKEYMEVYLNDEKTHVDPRPLYDILWGLKALCANYT